MERIGNLIQTQQLHVNSKLRTISEPSVSNATALTLLTLMGQTQARYPNQCLTEETVKMYLLEWERLTLRHGLERFKAGLLKVIAKSEFFPDPVRIGERCEQLATGARDAQNAKDRIGDVEEWKKTWLREYLEDEQNGKERPPLSPEMRRQADALGLQLRQER